MCAERAIQLSVRGYKFKLGVDTFRGAVQVETIASDVEQFGFAITDDCRRSIQIDVFHLVSRFTTESIFVAMMLLRKTVIGCV